MNQQFTGDFSLKSVFLYPLNVNDKKLDIKELVQEITLYQSVISSSLYCQIVIKDIGENLIETIPLIGQERIEFSISTLSAKYTLNYYLLL